MVSSSEKSTPAADGSGFAATGGAGISGGGSSRGGFAFGGGSRGHCPDVIGGLAGTPACAPAGPTALWSEAALAKSVAANGPPNMAWNIGSCPIMSGCTAGLAAGASTVVFFLSLLEDPRTNSCSSALMSCMHGPSVGYAACHHDSAE